MFKKSYLSNICLRWHERVSRRLIVTHTSKTQITLHHKCNTSKYVVLSVLLTSSSLVIVFMCRLHNMMLFYCDHRKQQYSIFFEVFVWVIILITSITYDVQPAISKTILAQTTQEKKHTQHQKDMLNHPNQIIIINHTRVQNVWSHLSPTCVHSPPHRVLSIHIEFILTRAISKKRKRREEEHETAKNSSYTGNQLLSLNKCYTGNRNSDILILFHLLCLSHSSVCRYTT